MLAGSVMLGVNLKLPLFVQVVVVPGTAITIFAIAVPMPPRCSHKLKSALRWVRRP